MVSSSSSSGFPSMRPPNFQYFPNISCSNEFCKCSASSKSGRVVSGMIGANQWGFHAQKCLCSSAFVCFHQQILGFHNQKLGLFCNHEDCMLSLSLSIHNCTYVHYCQGNKEQLQLKQNDDLSQTNMGTLSKRTGEMKAISKALSSCCPMRSSSSISCHNAAVFQLPGGKT